MSPGDTPLLSAPPLGSQVHAAAVNGDRSALHRLITADPSLRDREDQFGRTPLMYCVLADRLDCAETLLKAGAHVNKADRSQRTALHLAAQKGSVRFMKLLLARRADWLQKDLEEMTPLHLSTRHRSPKCLALLLKYMAPGEVDTQDKNKQTALHWSAYYNHPEHVKLLIKHDSNIGIPDVEGKIPLHWAAHNKDPSATHTVRCILEAAPTESLLNWQDYEGRTPLHFAVADGNEAVVAVLTSYEGCSVTAYDNLFRTPLHWAALLGHARIVHLLLERNKSGTILSDSQGATPLHYSAQSNFADTVAVFLQHPSVKDDVDLEGRTAFMWAAGKGSDDVIRTMLDLKADIDINMTDKYGGTALHAAALSGHVSTARLLLERGALVDALDVMKHTPLFRACEMGHRDVILTLIQGGARVDLVDLDGHTALHWAALGGNAEVCQILMENGISPNVQDLAGRTPLQCAAYGGYINCMAVLMENRADPNIQDKEGRMALHWSCNNGYLDAVKLLLGCGAFPNHMEHNEERYTPLDYALLGEHQEVTQFMLEHGALSIAAIQDIAAASIQAVYKGYKVRQAFRERKNLLMRHEQLRKDAAKKREEEQRRREAEQQGLEAGKPSQGAWQQGQEEERQGPVDRLEPKLRSLSVSDSGSRAPGVHATPKPFGAEHSHNTKGKVGEPCRNRGLLQDKSDIMHDPVLLYKSLPLLVPFSLFPPILSFHPSEDDPPFSWCSFVQSERRSRSAKSEQRGRTADVRAVPVLPPKPAALAPPEKDTPLSPGPSKKSPASCRKGSVDRGEEEAHSRPARQTGTPPKTTKGASKPEGKSLNSERHSPAGSSRPGSAKPGTHTAVPTPKLAAPVTHTPTQNTQLPPLAPRHPRSQSHPPPCSAPRPDRPLPAPLPKAPAGPWTSGSVELVPLELRLQVVERERSRKDLFRRKNRAASTIQEAWRRFHVRTQLRAAMRGGPMGAAPAEAAALLIQLLWGKSLYSGPAHMAPKTTPTTRALPTRASGRKSSVLQSIYGKRQNHKIPSVPRLHIVITNVQINKLSSVGCVHLLESMGQAKQFSYHMRPHTAARSSKTREKE
uniref:Inversin n=1 Tax=Lepisosteus oculatus TaxID=7918 RepID=W5MDT9_LEPOC